MKHIKTVELNKMIRMMIIVIIIIVIIIIIIYRTCFEVQISPPQFNEMK
jgi:cell division protein FtsL